MVYAYTLKIGKTSTVLYVSEYKLSLENYRAKEINNYQHMCNIGITTSEKFSEVVNLKDYTESKFVNKLKRAYKAEGMLSHFYKQNLEKCIDYGFGGGPLVRAYHFFHWFY